MKEIIRELIKKIALDLKKHPIGCFLLFNKDMIKKILFIGCISTGNFIPVDHIKKCINIVWSSILII